MIFHVLACDYDGTLAHDGRLGAATADALERVRRSGRKVMMVTGRELSELRRSCDRLDLFDAIVAENGGLLYLPERREERLLCEPASEKLAARLKEEGVTPLSVGRAIIATWEPYGVATLKAIEELGLEHNVIFNKGAVMVLPPNVNKGSGLLAGLETLGYSRHNTVAIGDAENDHAFLSACECGVAVGNALDALKERADVVMSADHGAGVIEFIDKYLLSDLIDLAPVLARRHSVRLGVAGDEIVSVPSQRTSMLITGKSGGGKSTVAGLLIERLIEEGRSVCVIDPEGDYAGLAGHGAVVLGGAHEQGLPNAEELQQLMYIPATSVVLDLHAMTKVEKTDYVASALSGLECVGAECGRPHWLVVDEAHHVMPREGSVVCEAIRGQLATPSAARFEGICLITFDAGLLCDNARRLIRTIISTSTQELGKGITAVAEAGAIKREVVEWVDLPADDEEDGAAWIITIDDEGPHLRRFIVDPRRTAHHRHIRKYVTGELAPEISFYFRGPEGKLNLRAANLARFVELGEGVDEGTWRFHLENGDMARWIRKDINDEELAGEIERIAAGHTGDSRTEVLDAVRQRYAV